MKHLYFNEKKDLYKTEGNAALDTHSEHNEI